MEHKNKIIGRAFLVFGSLIVVATSFSFNFIHRIEPYLVGLFEDWSFSVGFLTVQHPPFGLLYFLPLFYATLAIFHLIVGFGLLQNKLWARKVALVIGILLLFHVPVGTIFGVYVLYHLVDGTIPQAAAAEEKAQ